jgi:hypothetical protein
MPILHCASCSGEGRIIKSKYGGNDPDTWDAGECPSCSGSGTALCEGKGCKEPACGFNDDGEALCQECLCEWATEMSTSDTWD